MGKSGCEIVGCKLYVNGKCSDDKEFVNAEGDAVCGRREDAIPVDGGSKALPGHAGDCSIYACMMSQWTLPEAGICTCGHGHRLLREGDPSQMYSDERMFRRHLPCDGGGPMHNMTDCKDARRLALMWVPKWASKWKRTSWAVCLGRLWMQWTPDFGNNLDTPKRKKGDAR